MTCESIRKFITFLFFEKGRNLVVPPRVCRRHIHHGFVDGAGFEYGGVRGFPRTAHG